MSIEEDYGYAATEHDTIYEGLCLEAGAIYAITKSVDKNSGYAFRARNTLLGTAEMISYARQQGLTLDEATEVKPLIDLVAANLAIMCRQSTDIALLPREQFFYQVQSGIRKLVELGSLPKACARDTSDIIISHPRLWSSFDHYKLVPERPGDVVSRIIAGGPGQGG